MLYNLFYFFCSSYHYTHVFYNFFSNATLRVSCSLTNFVISNGNNIFFTQNILNIWCDVKPIILEILNIKIPYEKYKICVISITTNHIISPCINKTKFSIEKVPCIYKLSEPYFWSKSCTRTQQFSHTS